MQGTSTHAPELHRHKQDVHVKPLRKIVVEKHEIDDEPPVQSPTKAQKTFAGEWVGAFLGFSGCTRVTFSSTNLFISSSEPKAHR